MEQKHIEVLRKNPLFCQVEEKDIEGLLHCLGVQMKSYQENEYVFLAGNQVNHIGIILEGMIEIMKESVAGNRHIVAMFGAPHMFAEGIVCTRSRIAPVSVRVKESLKVLMIPYERLIQTCGNHCDFHVSLIQNVMVVLGERNVNLNRKIELLTLKGMREKIAYYLLSEANQQHNNLFDIMLNRTEMADYLNVSRTSMCRELAKMKDEDIIDYYSNSFKIKNRTALAQCLE